jgi:hypothetical protein
VAVVCVRACVCTGEKGGGGGAASAAGCGSWGALLAAFIPARLRPLPGIFPRGVPAPTSFAGLSVWHACAPPQILGAADLGKVMRLQLALMPPHSEIRRHTDSGGYAAAGHRIHVVVRSNPGEPLWWAACRTGRRGAATAPVPAATPACC